ncbi:MAG: ATP-binding protein [Dehalococcoidia bacterium]|nr:ATP-binding protein [Dehalococcoidia bacterium]
MILSIASGKGGTGKTLLATNLALALSSKARVQLLDCDVEEPNDNLFLRLPVSYSQFVYIPIPKVDETKCNYCGKCSEVCVYNAIAVLPQKVLVFPELCHGCGACSYLCPEVAIVEEGKPVGVVEKGSLGNLELVQGKLNVGEVMAPPIIRAVKKYIDAKSEIIIDVSPGTSCPVVEAVEGSDFCLLVTEPTPFGLNDLSLAVEVTKEIGVPCGVVINRAGMAEGETERYCREHDVPILLKIPLDREIAVLYSKGIPLVQGMPQWREAFLGLFENIAARVGRGKMPEGSGEGKDRQ